MALAAYRHLLRAMRIAFQGDVRVLSNARLEAREKFETNGTLAADSQQAEESIKLAEDVARLLRHNIVQGQRAEDGKENYKLRIHDDIERGDNESVKLGKSSQRAPGQACSS
ncbi:MAG: Mitochondrial zinc maintenance protein 1, mitochondrial [Sclerophora amabilis]|nr:MAG: Mitochondrial zinc maintenance protein 1, mitochondrial [Sclerophora amabilis]